MGVGKQKGNGRDLVRVQQGNSKDTGSIIALVACLENTFIQIIL